MRECKYCNKEYYNDHIDPKSMTCDRCLVDHADFIKFQVFKEYLTTVSLHLSQHMELMCILKDKIYNPEEEE